MNDDKTKEVKFDMHPAQKEFMKSKERRVLYAGGYPPRISRHEIIAVMHIINKALKEQK